MSWKKFNYRTLLHQRVRHPEKDRGPAAAKTGGMELKRMRSNDDARK
jgi:hypothetical protein